MLRDHCTNVVVDLHRTDLHVRFKIKGILSQDAKPFPSLDGNPDLAIGPFNSKLSDGLGKNFSLFLKKLTKAGFALIYGVFFCSLR